MRPRCDAILAQRYISGSQPGKAWECVKDYVEKRDAYQPYKDPAYLAAGQVLISQAKLDEAARFYDWLALSGAEGHTLVAAVEGCGKTYLLLKEYTKAVQSYQSAITYAEQRLYDDGTLKPLFERLEAGLAAARKPLDEAKHAQDIEKLGEDFVIFREAETLRRKTGDFKNALKTYATLIQQFPTSPYFEPAKVYAALCLVNLNDPLGAERQLEAVLTQNPNGLYAGEALLERGRIALELRLDIEAADTYFSRLETWVAQSRLQTPKELAGVKDGAKALVRPSARYKQDSFGNVDLVEISPGQLVNSITCPWFLDDIASKACKFQGFIRFTQKKNDEALIFYGRLLEYDQVMRKAEQDNQPNSYRRLKHSVGQGYLYALPQELAVFTGKQRSVVLVADLYYTTEEFSKAKELYLRLLKGEFGKLTEPQQDYCHFATGSAQYRIRFLESNPAAAASDALNSFATVMEKMNGTHTEFRAAKAYSNLGRESSDAKVKQKAKEYARMLATAPVDNDFTLAARIDMARDLIREGREEQGIAILKKFKPKDGQPYEVAKFLLERQTGQPQTKPKGVTK